MIFSSFEFLFGFLPIVLAGYYLLGMRGAYRGAVLWLVLASLCFYAWWRIEYVPLLLALLAANYFATRSLIRTAHWSDRRRRMLLGLFIAGNVAVLGYFKYAMFVVENVNQAAGTDWTISNIILPLGLSFIVFQKIGLLVDAYRSKAKDYDPIHYALFVSFFPQLIAGPIVHHAAIIPQFSNTKIYHPDFHRFAVGLTVLALGLFKKVVLADGIAPYASDAFNAAAAGTALTFVEAWCGALAYTFQLYFDFSGYSEMAIGLALMFGVRLPLNFYAPYRATSIIEFWRRWHMTLSRFLRDYIYFPLGGNRRGPFRRYVNLMIVMVIGGIWHGAGWTFVIWGALHGFYLCLNHAWRYVAERSFLPSCPDPIKAGLSWILTFTAIVVAWVFFRADHLDAALAMLSGMLGMNGVVLPDTYRALLGPVASVLSSLGVKFGGAWTIPLFEGAREIAALGLMLGIVLFMPTTRDWLRNERLTSDEAPPASGFAFPTWSSAMSWAAIVALIAASAVWNIQAKSEFLYFDF